MGCPSDLVSFSTKLPSKRHEKIRITFFTGKINWILTCTLLYNFKFPTVTPGKVAPLRRLKKPMELLICYFIFPLYSIIIAFPLVYFVAPKLSILLISSFSGYYEETSLTYYILFSLSLLLDTFGHSQFLVICTLLFYLVLSFCLCFKENTQRQLFSLR